MADEPEVLFERRGAVGRITMNRPDALNSLTLDMCIEMDRQLAEWEDDVAIKAVLIRGEGRAFCAGGDIRALYDSGRKGTDYAPNFYWHEYRLNRRIKHYPKPYVALIDGIVMGGGVGVSVHGSHRVVTENVTFAMPETGIGLFPDVGGTYFLPRCPGELGMFLAMTGSRLKSADAVYAGVGTAYVEKSDLDALERALEEADYSDPSRAVGGAIVSLASSPGEPPLDEKRDDIDRLFAGDTVEAILDALDSDGGEWATGLAATMRKKSPISMKVAARQMREGAKLGFDDCMRLEYRLACRFIEGHDFYEGVRATVIDKDQAPQWKPATLSEISEADVDAYFADLGPRELHFD